MKDTMKGALIATAVAGLMGFGCAHKKAETAAAAGAAAAAAADEVKCAGVNDCKGTGACGGADHDCAGQNECKGKGWVKTSAAACTEKGGTVVGG